MLAAGLLTLAPNLAAQTRVTPGFNLFSPEQDVQVGRQSAAQVERQIPLVRDARATEYINRIGRRLAANAPGPKFPYTFKVANLSDVNAFALPGGPIYVHRGLIERVRSEGELAGVLAHEIAHVGLRHPTNQASKAYVAQAGLGIIGALLGDREASTGTQIMQAVGGLGLNAIFLRYSRKAETEADIAGTQILARSGYDPMDMARFFQYLRSLSGREPSRIQRFFSDHPSPSDREARIRQEVALLGSAQARAPVGGLASVQSSLRRLPPARSLQAATGSALR
ncbi:MAG TPA: M48 family metallopeptidase [Candidatus Eisenbacteria bacterium]|nr:M48 family metallopeptidase [Candidatus Eisenbacteria bacterium]